MRGLVIRIEFVQARFLGGPAPDATYGPWVPLENAYAMGVCDYGKGIAEAPVLFNDEPALLAAWLAGWHFAGDGEDMARCADCQHLEVPFCPTHG